MNEIRYATALWNKALHCGGVYSEDRLKGIFIEGLGERIKSNVRQFWAERPELDLNALARYAASIASLNRPTTTPPNPSLNARNQSRRSTRALVVNANTPDSTYNATGDPARTSNVTPATDYDDPHSPARAPSAPSEAMLTTTSMDSGDACRVCFKLIRPNDPTSHVTSGCPFLTQQLR